LELSSYKSEIESAEKVNRMNSDLKDVVEGGYVVEKEGTSDIVFTPEQIKLQKVRNMEQEFNLNID